MSECKYSLVGQTLGGLQTIQHVGYSLLPYFEFDYVSPLFLSLFFSKKVEITENDELQFITALKLK